jgi:phosphatidylserine/phosphatidylglycerophosphate/cardiolipin synthase-like enzyme
LSLLAQPGLPPANPGCLGDDPSVVTGSANFSRPSQTGNDENMLVVGGNKRVADIYFGEFMRIFDHLYSRYIVRKMKEAGTNDPDAGSSRKTPKVGGSRKALRRRYFVGD